MPRYDRTYKTDTGKMVRNEKKTSCIFVETVQLSFFGFKLEGIEKICFFRNCILMHQCFTLLWLRKFFYLKKKINKQIHIQKKINSYKLYFAIDVDKSTIRFKICACAQFNVPDHTKLSVWVLQTCARPIALQQAAAAA